jgi:ribosome-binding factor A
MSNRRVLKAAQAIREVVSMAILTDLKDPRVSDVTVTFVEVSVDMRLAKVHVSVMGDEKKQNLCLIGLQNSAGFLQSKIGRRIDTRYTPRIKFELDKGMQHAMKVTQILEEVLPSTAESDPDSAVENETIPETVKNVEAEADSASTVDGDVGSEVEGVEDGVDSPSPNGTNDVAK